MLWKRARRSDNVVDESDGGGGGGMFPGGGRLGLGGIVLIAVIGLVAGLVLAIIVRPPHSAERTFGKEKAMTGKRRFRRVKCATNIVLNAEIGAYQGRLENISPDGALVMLQGSVIALVKQGDKCTLAVYPEKEEAPLQFMAEVVHSGFSMAGVK